MNALLRVDSVSKYFGGLCALRKVSFGVEEGRITGLIGPNGAGKTTLFNLITGVFPVSEGRIVFEGAEITRLPTHATAQRGVIRTFQNVNLFANLTVKENVMAGMHRHLPAGIAAAALRLPSMWKAESDADRRAGELLAFFGVSELAQDRASSLSFGHQRLLELARALAAQPRLLLLDEPAAGLNSDESMRLAEIILGLRDSGITVLLVEHDMRLVMDICDTIVVLNFGEKIAEGTPQEVQGNPLVLSAYLGSKRR